MNAATVLNIVQPYLDHGKVKISDLEEHIFPQFSKQQGYEFVNILADHHIEIDYGDGDGSPDKNEATDNAIVAQGENVQLGPMTFGSEGNLDEVLSSSEFKEQVKNSKIEIDYHENPELIKNYHDQNLTEAEKEEARNRIWLANKRLVQKVAVHYYKNYKTGSMSIDDLIIEGYIGLNKAIDKFDPDMGYEFSTYAVWWIKQNIDRAVKGEAYIVRLPVHVQENIAKMTRLERENLTDKQIMDQMSINEKSLDNLRIARVLFQNMISTDKKIGSEEDENDSLENFLSYSNDFMKDGEERSPEDLVLEKDNTEEVSRMFEKELKPREEEVLKMRFGFDNQEPMTLNAVGEKFNLTRERIRQIEERALKKLKAYEARLDNE